MAPPLGLSEGQFTALKFGVPVVAVFALSQAFSRKQAAEDAAAAPAAGGLVPATPTPSTDAIGVGQLAEFESGVTAAIGQLTETVGVLVDKQEQATNQQQAAPATAPTYIAPPSFEIAPWHNQPEPALSCIPGWPCAPPGKTAVPIIVQGIEIGVQYV